MCGICCFIGYEYGFKYAFDGLKMLMNRGYDSSGCAGISSDGKLIIHKYANTLEKNSINLLGAHADDFRDCKTVLLHNRWCTNGSKTDANAHPHLDHKGRMALVHNGIIENYLELKGEMESEHNVVFRSQTDTEVIVNLISICYDRNGGHMGEAIIEATQRMQGTWAIAVISVDQPDSLFCARHGSPLLIGIADNFMMLASEQSGFAGYINNYICLNDGDVIVLKKENGKVDFEKKYLYEMKNTTIKDIILTPDPYPHWTIKEIKEQFEASTRSINFGGRLLDDDKVKLGGIDENRERLLRIDHLILLGCGTSLHAAIRGSIFFKDLADFITVQSFDAGEFTDKDIPKYGNTGLVLLSQSGETKDVHRCLLIAKQYNLFTIGIVNVVDSLIAREVNCGCYLNAGREIAVASTKSFTSQIIVLSLLAIWFAQSKSINSYKRMEYIKCLRNLPHDIKKTILDTEKQCKDIAMFLKDKHTCFVLGKGEMEPFAKEGSLKIKEIGYIHAEGYSAVALKHGPFSLLQNDTPTIILQPASNYDDYIRVDSTIEEVISRDAPIILITDKKPKLDHKYIVIVPHNAIFKGILHLIPLQMVAYYLSVYKGINPDMPRNLAKCVTVY
jgi:glucosamine--fructose-6-phosphate aminotransferase (isomerizing)